ncbi:MFS transporter [Bacillus anthracis]|uniref:MFS transporter n=1 Tax=Bacillus tropicus TaxID=2026188 RepID=A0ABD7ZZR7_9BACI|nr:MULTISPECIES: MFS transporter [Bacillus]AIY76227.1 sugar (and other) transporter family protein [Bacillus cereus]AJI02844.1 sugar (and other) transporter family protein [Bacillus cereus G9241]PED55693.1 MFS transporter [Bacillus anthracis]AJG92601.1 sugar (and other) transporter family protein [Bacillus cereus]ARO18600.1 MFS transporter [Bacillus cereus]
MNNLLLRYNKPIIIRLCGELLTRTTESMLALIMIIYVNKMLNGNIIITMLIFGLQPLSDIVFTLIAGGITDKYGRKKIMLLGLLLQGVAIGSFIFAQSVFIFALLYVINGIGRSLYIPAQRAQIADLTKQGQQAEIFALLHTMAAIGSVIGPLIGSIFYRTHPEYVFTVQSIALIVYAIVIWTQLPETAPAMTKPTQKLEVSTPKQFVHKHYAVLGLMITTLPISFFYAQTETNYLIFVKLTHLDFERILVFITTCKAIMEITLQVFLVKWSERFSMTKIIVISYACYTISAIGYGFSATISSLFFTLLFLVIGESIALNHLFRFVSEIAPTDKRGLYFSIYGLHWDISRTCGPVLGAVLLSKLNGSMLFYICACFLIAGGIIQALFIQNVERNKIKKDISEHTPHML